MVPAYGPADSHAYLTLALHWVEPREHVVPVVVSHNARMWQLQLRGKARALCACSSWGALWDAGGGAGYACPQAHRLYKCLCVPAHLWPGTPMHVHRATPTHT